MNNSDIRSIVLGVISAFFLGAIGYLYTYYSDNPIVLFYNVIYKGYANGLVHNSVDGNSADTNNNDLLYVYIKNNSGDSFKANEIYVSGIVDSTVPVLLAPREIDSQKSKIKIEKKPFNTIAITGIQELQPKAAMSLTLCLNANNSAFVTVKANDDIYYARKAYMVSGIESLFSRYWRLIGFLLIVVILLALFKTFDNSYGKQKERKE